VELNETNKTKNVWRKSGTWVVVWIALGTVVVHVATGWRYGFDRDELMALEDARHLAWGYVQYPPMTAFLGRVALGLIGTSLVGFRLFAALAQAVALVLTGLMAREIWRAVASGEWRVASGREERREEALEENQDPHAETACGAPASEREELKEEEWKSEKIGDFEELEQSEVRIPQGLKPTPSSAEMSELKLRPAKEEVKTQDHRTRMGHTGEENPKSTGRSTCATSEERVVMVMAALAGVPFCLGAGALMQYISFDYVSWVFVAWCVVKMVAGEDLGAGRSLPSSGQAKDPRLHGERWWVGIGVGVGLGMMAKYTMGFLVCGLVVGIFMTRARQYLRSGWLWLGVLVAGGIFAPNFVWEWRRGFESLDFLRFIHARDVGEGLTDWFLLGQLELTLLAAPLALAGLWFCFFTEEGRRWRILGWMYLVPLALFLVLRGREYYLAPGYPMLYAMGAVWVGKKWEGKKKENGRWKMENGDVDEELWVGKDRREVPHFVRNDGFLNEDELDGALKRHPSNIRVDTQETTMGWLQEEEKSRSLAMLGITTTFEKGWVRRGIWVALILDVVVAGAVALPVAPVGSRWWNFASRVDSVFPEEIGWPEFVESVAQVRDRLPVEERARVGILAGNYGEVGALNLYGEKFGLSRAISGVNSSWERGYGNPAPDVVIVTGYSREFLEKEFASCVVGGRVWNRYGVMNEETIEHPEIFVCRGLKGSWEEFWKRARKFA
jgi:Dolichyl-phosphate-mannose-protein mannosyltransferase